jgi:hypothetical protein
MLNFRGHRFLGDGVCACCIGDKRVVSIDPTGTGSIRSKFNGTLAIRWRGLRAMVRQAIVDQDVLSLSSRGLMQMSNPAIQGGAPKIQMFQRWFDYALTAQVLSSDGTFMREFIRRGYDAGQSFAQTEIGRRVVPTHAGDREEAIFRLAVVEIQGIMDAVSQKASRAVASGLLHNQKPAAIVKAVQAAIDTVGISRSTALVELLVVKAFGEATLDVYEAANVKLVGLLPEQLLVRDARVRKFKASGSAGSRSRSTEGGPSERTIRRIKQFERNLEQFALVSVVTAGDKKVCQVCKRIAARGPYKINKARALIPAHPRCRCVFVPV